MTAPTRWFAAVTIVLSTACLPQTRGGPSPFDPRPSASARDLLPMSIVVQNDHWLSMRLWVRWPDRDYFLGTVEAGGRGSFQVPGTLVGSFDTLRLYADPTGSIDEVLSDPIDVRSGHHIEWRLGKVLSASRAHIM